MEIYALYGTSGTGKSSSALELAHRMNIDAIIDDGILIYQGRKVAGTSAKYEKTKIQAVKRAIFHYEEHAEEVRRSLEQHQPGRLLILGTSQRMITRIVEALHLPASIEYIPIESIKPPQEIEAARYVRETMGRHVIPIPRVEVEKDFLQRLISSATQIFSSKKRSSENRPSCIRLFPADGSSFTRKFCAKSLRLHAAATRKSARSSKCCSRLKICRGFKLHWRSSCLI